MGMYCIPLNFYIFSFQALEKYPKTAMSHKEILRVIQEENLKEIR
jgi:hypothetical protein